MGRRLRAFREGSGLRRRRDELRGAGRRSRLYSRRGKDVDFKRRNRRRLYRLRAHGRGAGHARNLRLRRLPGRSRVFDRRADRSHCAASARDDPLRRMPNSGEPPARRIGRGVQDRDAHAGHFPRLSRRGSARLRASRARRGGRARQDAPHARGDARRHATDAGGARRHGDRERRLRAADLSRRLAPRRPGPSDHARGRDGEDDRDRKRANRNRPRGADVRRSGREERRDGGKTLSRNSGAAHLRRRHRGAAAHRGARTSEGEGG